MSNFKVILLSVLIYLAALLVAVQMVKAHEVVMITDEVYTALVFPLCQAEVAELLAPSDALTMPDEVQALELACFRGMMDTAYPLKYIDHDHKEVAQ